MRVCVCTFVFSHRLQCDIELVPICSVPSSLNVVDRRLGGGIELRFPAHLVHQLTDLLLVVDPVQRSGCAPCKREDGYMYKCITDPALAGRNVMYCNWYLYGTKFT